jgi:hypothetical protein
MPSTTSMPSVAASDLHRLRHDTWRAVEAQHKVSTMRLVNNDLDEQKILEDILEASKPPVPQDASHLHWLLFTPFRYPPLPQGSRFRTAQDPGVFYSAFEQRTACAEAGYWKWYFVQDSAGLNKLDAHLMSLFSAGVKTQSVDLRVHPYSRQRKAWTHPTDYSKTQAFAQKARNAAAGAIVYESVRDPEHGGCIAVLTPSALVNAVPALESWFLTVTKEGAVWQHDMGGKFIFGYAF